MRVWKCLLPHLLMNFFTRHVVHHQLYFWKRLAILWMRQLELTLNLCAKARLVLILERVVQVAVQQCRLANALVAKQHDVHL